MFHVKHFSGDGSTEERLTLNQQIVVQLHFPVLARQGGNNENHIKKGKENMIKSEVNKGEVTLTQVEGTGLTIMSELCCLVKAVCTGFFADEENADF